MSRYLLAGLLSALFAAAGGAQDSVLTEAEYLSALDEAHPAVVAGAEELALARAGVVAASAFDDPTLDLEREDGDGDSQTELVVAWKLPDRARGREIAAREASADAAQARLEHRLRALRLEMREAYAEWALAAAREARLAAQAERVAALAEREQLRADKGEASGLEAHRLALAARALAAQRALAAAESASARARAARWAPELTANARPELPEVPPPPSLEAEHPLVRAAAAELAAARLEAEAAGRVVASPELALGWQRRDSGAETADAAIVGVAWTLPLFDRKRAEKATAAARIAGAEARLELARREISAARAAALETFEHLARSLGDGRLSLAESERMLDGAEAAFRLGEASLTDLLDTHRSVTEGALALLDLRRAALAAHRELERLAAVDSKPAHPTESQRRVVTQGAAATRVSEPDEPPAVLEPTAQADGYEPGESAERTASREPENL